MGPDFGRTILGQIVLDSWDRSSHSGSVLNQRSRPMSASIPRKTELLYFSECTVKTERHVSGEYSAIDADNYEPTSPVGWGKTQIEAIAELGELMRERGLIGEAA